MGDKLKPKRSPEENEARQAARAAKREKARDARTVAVVAALLSIEQALRKVHAEPEELVLAAGWILSRAKEGDFDLGPDDTGKA